jgi:hypothetical protein
MTGQSETVIRIWSALKTEIEYRISEEYARSVFGMSDGKRISATLRLIKLDQSDARWAQLAHLYSTHKGEGFYGWRISRRFTTAETKNATLHLFKINVGCLPTGEACGTAYDNSEVCPLCGAGRAQVSPLRLRLTETPKVAEVAQTWGGEIIVSVRVARLLIDSGVTGFGLGPVQRAKKGEEEPFTLSETKAGKQLLHAAAQAAVKYPSPEFYVWINGFERRDTLQAAVKEHLTRKLRSRRLPGGTSSEWYQLFVTSNPVELAPATRVGRNPFDDDIEARNQCPLGLRGHVIGLNLLSQATVQNMDETDIDFLRSRDLVVVRRGLFAPRPLLFVSARLRKLLLKNGVKGWTSEVANLADESDRIRTRLV